jgi:hypothetical protein
MARYEHRNLTEGDRDQYDTLMSEVRRSRANLTYLSPRWNEDGEVKALIEASCLLMHEAIQRVENNIVVAFAALDMRNAAAEGDLRAELHKSYRDSAKSEAQRHGLEVTETV